MVPPPDPCLCEDRYRIFFGLRLGSNSVSFPAAVIPERLQLESIDAGALAARRAATV